jgi:hypothetical protein
MFIRPAPKICGIIGRAELIGTAPDLVRIEVPELKSDFLEAHHL